jgi:SpoU rRNA methylase family enzyme
MQLLLQNGCKLEDCGFIGFSSKRKNLVISNVIGAAAFHGKSNLLKLLVERVPSETLDLPVME